MLYILESDLDFQFHLSQCQRKYAPKSFSTIGPSEDANFVMASAALRTMLLPLCIYPVSFFCGNIFVTCERLGPVADKSTCVNLSCRIPSSSARLLSLSRSASSCSCLCHVQMPVIDSGRTTALGCLSMCSLNYFLELKNSPQILLRPEIIIARR
jgi:hypothetical protein